MRGEKFFVPFFIINEFLICCVYIFMKKSQSKTEKKSTSLKILRSPQKIVEPIKTDISLPKFAKSIAELANIIGCSRKSLTRWRLSEDFPSPRSDGRFDVAEVKDWIAHRGKCSGSGRVVPIDISCDGLDGLSYMELKEREMMLRIKTQELELAQKRRELVSLEDAKSICVEILKPISRRLKNMAALLGIRVNPSDPTGTKVILKEWAEETFKEVERVCNELKERN